MLARERLEMLGFDVRKLHIFNNGRGIYIRWDIHDPFTARSRPWNVGLEDMQQFRGRLNDGYYGRKYNWERENACRSDSQAICRIWNFFRNPMEFFRNY